MGAGAFREAPHYPPATLWAVVSKGPPEGEDREDGADDLLKSLGFEMKSQVPTGRLCMCVCSFQLNAEVLSHVPRKTEDSLVPKSSLSFSVSPFQPLC